jgi:hypothetical protein
MSLAEIVTQALGPPAQRKPVSLDAMMDLAPDTPVPLLELWREHGWAGYGGGLFWTIDPRSLAAHLPGWQRVRRGSSVFGRDAFGNLFLLRDGEVFQLDVHRNERMLVASTLELFFSACLDDPSFRQCYLWSDLLGRAVERCGRLASDECYAFFPALPLGGEVDAETLERVKLSEHLTLMAQLAG